MSTAFRSSYDVVPYASFPFPQTHPDRLASVATLLGLRPAPAKCCRVLELGCASGGNLIPMALGLPESTFLGVDLSSVQVSQGHEVIRALDLKNVELKQVDILNFDGGPERFDYIICHGVYSWVPNEVQDRILDICCKKLAPRGVAYVSYNTFPGWHMRGVIRDMLSYHARQFVEPLTKVKQARNLLDFMANSVGNATNPYSQMLRNELESFQRSSDAYLYHEHLEDVNEPIYFHQFAERAAAAGLCYLAEVDLNVMVPGNYPPEIANVLQMLSQDTVHLEQYMDFLRNRTFRQTLLCHRGLNPNYNIKSERVCGFSVATSAKPVNANFESGSTEFEQFATADGVTLSVREPLVKAAMRILAERWPQTVPFETLLATANAALHKEIEGKAASPEERHLLANSLLNMYVTASSAFIEFWANPPAFAVNVGDRPMASPLARHLAETTHQVTNLRHQTVSLGEFERQLLKLLDGNRDRQSLVKVLHEIVQAGDLVIVRMDNQPLKDDAGTGEVLAEAIEKALHIFARSALLIG